MARREPKTRNTRERLLSSALDAFSTKGYASTSIDDIAKAAGTTRGAFYYYFSDKADIARDLQQDLWRSIAERAQSVFDPSLDTLSNIKRAFATHLSEVNQLESVRLFLREGFLDPTLEASGRVELEWGFDLIREYLADAMDKGEIGRLEPTALAGILTGLFEVATDRALAAGDPVSITEVVNALLDGLVPSEQPANLAQLRRIR